MDDSGSTVPRRQLGRYPRELRERERVSHELAATALDCSRQKIWRIEKGAVPVRASDVKVLCNLYSAGSKITQALAALALETRAKGWWHAYGDAVPAWFSLYVGLEMAASRLRHYNGELVPGIVQSRRYAEAIFRNRPDMTERERERAVTVRLHRQGVLTRQLPPPPQLDVILSEAVLRRPIADREGMRQQLRHLATTAGQPNVSVRVLPLAVGPTLASETGAFVILDFPGGNGRGAAEPTTVYSEALTGALYLDKPGEVRAYEDVWSALARLALDTGESKEMINMIIGER